MSIKYPLVNGFAYGFSSIEANIKGKRIPLFKGISYDQELTHGEVRGNHPQLARITRGQLKHDGANLELYKEEWEEMLTAFGNGYMEARFDVVVTYAEDGMPTVTDKLIGCKLSKVSNQHSAGDDGLTVKLDLVVMHIELNGFKPLKKMINESQ